MHCVCLIDNISQLGFVYDVYPRYLSLVKEHVDRFKEYSLRLGSVLDQTRGCGSGSTQLRTVDKSCDYGGGVLSIHGILRV